MITTDGRKGSPMPEAPETTVATPDIVERSDEEILAVARETLEKIRAVADQMEARETPENMAKDQQIKRLGELEGVYKKITVEIAGEALQAKRRFKRVVPLTDVPPDEVKNQDDVLAAHFQTLQDLADQVLHEIFLVSEVLRKSVDACQLVKLDSVGRACERETDLTILRALDAQGEKLQVLAERLVNTVRARQCFPREWAERHAAEYEPLYAECNRLHEIARHAGKLEDASGGTLYGDVEGKWPLDPSRLPGVKFTEFNMKDGTFERWIRSWLSSVVTTRTNMFPRYWKEKAKHLKVIMDEKKSFISLAAQLDTMQARYQIDEKVASMDWDGQHHKLEIMLREILDIVDLALSAKGLQSPPLEKTLVVVKQAIGTHMNVVGGKNFQDIYDWRRKRVPDDIQRRLNENPPSADTLSLAEHLHNALSLLRLANEVSHEPAATGGSEDYFYGSSLQP